ncbi:hypothetical protein [Amnibacterium endophyticum]|uniref:SIR2-like domain-containing protein n=1 Tax=Amnibacterium endophyticum TaxID=2109337 RepID=A0ABW4LI85_9MICO
MGHVVLLGAGFSKALSPHMPLLPDLGERVMDELDGQGRDELAQFAGNVEEYLTYIGTDQPWLSDEENLRHRARFSETVTALRQVIVDAEAHARAAGLPDWLDRVAWQWSREQAAVLTFNYDLLLDWALRTAGGVGALADLYMVPLVERLPAGSGHFLSAGPPRDTSAELYKLHGSVNWLHGGDAAPITEPLVLDGRANVPDESPRHERVYGGLRTFIVPPTSVKNRYYDRVGVRAQWISAAQRLRNATRLTVIGYSLPLSDVGSSSFIRTNLSPSATISVVDFNAAAAERFGALLQRPACWHPEINSWLSSDVPAKVEWWVTEQRADLVVPRLEVNGVDESAQLPSVRDAAELDAAVTTLFAVGDIERNVLVDGLLINRGWAPPPSAG